MSGEQAPVGTHSGTDPQLALVCEVRAGAAQMRSVRAELRAALEQWQLEPRLANAVLDVAHELIVNAHQHGQPPVRLSVAVGVADVRVEVSDASLRPARLLPYRPGVSEHGLGLQLVKQLSRQWGQTQHNHDEPAGKSVWAVFVRRR